MIEPIETLETSERDDLGRLRRISLLFLVSAVVFFPLIFNPVVFTFYDQRRSEAETLVYVQDNLDALRLLFTAIGLTELALGVALWLWGRAVAERSSGRAGTVAGALSWVALGAGVTTLLGRLTPWVEDAEQVASGDTGALDTVLFIAAAVGLSLSFVVFGVLMVRGSMPTWLGIAWIVFGLLFWVGILPLWFFVAGLVFGIWGLRRFRPGHGNPSIISAVRTG